jgi:hypothetical protein
MLTTDVDVGGEKVTIALHEIGIDNFLQRFKIVKYELKENRENKFCTLVLMLKPIK